VIIAGGGIGGLVLANALQRHNIDYVLYEKTREYRPFGGPIQVQSNALAALEAINKDMCERIMAAGTTTGNRVNGLKDGRTNRCGGGTGRGGVAAWVLVLS
jgi:zeaxanthin epoxidase